jgi:hypothetical protein
MGRTAIYTSDTQISVTGQTARSRLQVSSERRAIIDKVIDLGGTASVAQLEQHFGYDLRGKVAALVRIGWLTVQEVKS